MTCRYLITGAQGFVGRYLVAHLLRATADVRILGLGRSKSLRSGFTHSASWAESEVSAPLPTSLRSMLADDRYTYESADLQSPDQVTDVLTRFRPQRVVHLASGLWGDPPDRLFRCNVEGTINLMQTLVMQSLAQSDSPVEKIVLGSSGGVYGNVAKQPIDESEPPSPIHLYSVSKLAAEQAAAVIARDARLPLVIARMFNIVGPGQDERHVCGRFVSELAAMAAGERPPRLDVGALDTTRDMVDVRDTAAALALLAEDGVHGQIYNVASGRETVIREVLECCLAITEMQNTVEIRESDHRKSDIPRHYANIGRLLRLGWIARYTLEESLRDLHEYYVQQVCPLVRRNEPGESNAQRRD